MAHVFSSEDPESLRGPQFEAAWCDELGKWKNAEAAWDMLQFGLRLGPRPLQLITTTPRPTRLMKRLIADPGGADEADDGSERGEPGGGTSWRRWQERYGGTRLGRQELEGELIEDREDALWSRRDDGGSDGGATPASSGGSSWRSTRRRVRGGRRTPAASWRRGGRRTARRWCWPTRRLKAARPQAWARAAVALFHGLEADCLVAEVNQGGDMVKAVIRTVDPDRAGEGGAGQRAANGCAPSRWRRSTARAG